MVSEVSMNMSDLRGKTFRVSDHNIQHLTDVRAEGVRGHPSLLISDLKRIWRVCPKLCCAGKYRRQKPGKTLVF
ncbi:hypothetical protein PSAB6_10409 [Paraburkholderia sabiae]|nr:hypothetical protein PSAB6_10409 [Paraburkholderia sabiae]